MVHTNGVVWKINMYRNMGRVSENKMTPYIFPGLAKSSSQLLRAEMCPSGSCVEVLPLRMWPCLEISVLQRQVHLGPRVGLEPVSDCCLREEKIFAHGRDAQRRDHGKAGGFCLQAKTERPQKRSALPTLWSWTSAFQNYGKTNFCRLSLSVCGTLLQQPQAVERHRQE